MKLTQQIVEVKVGLKVAKAITVGIYLVTSISVASILGGIVLQAALSATGQVHATATDSTNSVTLEWTAPGDNGYVGTAAGYHIKYSTRPLSETNWSNAILVSNPPIPQPAGTRQAMPVNGLQSGTQYYFALKSYDAAGNESALSNVASKKTDKISCMPQWSCTDWVVCQNGLQARSCIDVADPPCGTDFARPIEAQTCAAPAPDAQSPEQLCVEKWSCTAWNACAQDSRSRLCEDLNRCGSTVWKPETAVSCDAGDQLLQNPLRRYLLAAPARGKKGPVKIFSVSTGALVAQLSPFGKNYSGGYSVAGGDVVGDGKGQVVIGAGPGSSPIVAVTDLKGKMIQKIYPYARKLKIGVNVAVADVNGDHLDEILTVPASGRKADVRIFQYSTTSRSFVPFLSFTALKGITNGATVSAGDLNRNSLADIVVVPAMKNTIPVLEVYELNLGSRSIIRRATLKPYGSRYRSGVETAVGDVDGDGNAEVVTGQAPGQPEIRIFSLSNWNIKLSGRYVAGKSSFRGGMDVAMLDINTDGKSEILTTNFSNGTAELRVVARNALTGKYQRVTTKLPALLFPTTYAKGVRLGFLSATSP